MEFYIFSLFTIWLTVLTLFLLLLWSRPKPHDEENDLEYDSLFKENLRLRRKLQTIATYGDDSDEDASWYLYIVRDLARSALEKYE